MEPESTNPTATEEKPAETDAGDGLGGSVSDGSATAGTGRPGTESRSENSTAAGTDAASTPPESTNPFGGTESTRLPGYIVSHEERRERAEADAPVNNAVGSSTEPPLTVVPEGGSALVTEDTTKIPEPPLPPPTNETANDPPAEAPETTDAIPGYEVPIPDDLRPSRTTTVDADDVAALQRRMAEAAAAQQALRDHYAATAPPLTAPDGYSSGTDPFDTDPSAVMDQIRSGSSSAPDHPIDTPDFERPERQGVHVPDNRQTIDSPTNGVINEPGYSSAERPGDRVPDYRAPTDATSSGGTTPSIDPSLRERPADQVPDYTARNGSPANGEGTPAGSLEGGYSSREQPGDQVPDYGSRPNVSGDDVVIPEEIRGPGSSLGDRPGNHFRGPNDSPATTNGEGVHEDYPPTNGESQPDPDYSSMNGEGNHEDYPSANGTEAPVRIPEEILPPGGSLGDRPNRFRDPNDPPMDAHPPTNGEGPVTADPPRDGGYGNGGPLEDLLPELPGHLGERYNRSTEPPESAEVPDAAPPGYGNPDRNGDGRRDDDYPPAEEPNGHLPPGFELPDRNGDGRPDLSNPPVEEPTGPGHFPPGFELPDRNGDWRPDVGLPPGIGTGHETPGYEAPGVRPGLEIPPDLAPPAPGPRFEGDEDLPDMPPGGMDPPGGHAPVPPGNGGAYNPPLAPPSAGDPTSPPIDAVPPVSGSATTPDAPSAGSTSSPVEPPAPLAPNGGLDVFHSPPGSAAPAAESPSEQSYPGIDTAALTPTSDDFLRRLPEDDLVQRPDFVLNADGEVCLAGAEEDADKPGFLERFFDAVKDTIFDRGDSDEPERAVAIAEEESAATASDSDTDADG